MAKHKNDNLPATHTESVPELKETKDGSIDKRKNAKKPFKIELVETENGKISPSFDKNSISGSLDDLFTNATGAIDSDLALTLIIQTCLASSPDKKSSQKSMNASIAAMTEIGPRDAAEGLLITQMVAIHNQSMAMMRKVHDLDRIEQIEKYLNLVTKLQRTFIAQMEALNKHRRKGQQKVIVEHVNVNEGGQAIVGSVSHMGGGGYK